MIEEKLQELELSLCERHLPSLMPAHPALGVEPQSLELPDPAVPKVEARLVALHLVPDDLQIDCGRLPGCWLETCQVDLHTIKDPSLELEEIGVDAHPVAGILPVRGFEVLSLERARRA